LGAAARSATVPGLSADTTYTFRLRANNTDGTISLSNEASGKTAPNPDVAPSLSVGSVTANTIVLNWNDSSTTRAGYAVERKSGAGFVEMTTLSPGVRTYTAGSLSAGTLYTFRIRANNANGTFIYSNESSATTSSPAPAPALNSASFLATDGTRQGSWRGVVGTEGYVVVGDSTSLPSYIKVTPSGKADWIWQYSTTTLSAVQRADANDRLAACWYSGASYSVDILLTDGLTHRMAIYFLDWDQASRRQTVQVTDADTGAVLDSRLISEFGSGVWVSWTVRGHVKVTITPQNVNGVISAIAFDPSGSSQQAVQAPVFSPSGGTFTSAQQVAMSSATTGAEIRYTLNGADPTASSTLYTGPVTITSSATVKAAAFKAGMLPSSTTTANFTISAGTTTVSKVSFIGVDADTSGTWKGMYGPEGYQIAAVAPKVPAYVQLRIPGAPYTWEGSTTDTRALQYPDNSNNRIASCWFGETVDIGLNFTDGKTHRFVAYFCDWDHIRAQGLELVDAATGAILWTGNVTSFSGGQYYHWDLKGNLTLRIKRQTGPNAVVSGFFFHLSPTQL
jgi:hypothetical protein